MSDDINVIKLERPSSERAELSVIARLERWRKAFGRPLGGRDNSDNAMWYLLLDAQETIEGLRLYARKLESVLQKNADMQITT